MKKEKFLSYVSQLIESRDCIYYDDNEQYFYFYHNTLKYTINSTLSSASLIIDEGNSYNNISESISLTSQECVDLLEKMIPLIPTNHSYCEKKITALGAGVFDSYIELFHEFLKHYNPVKEISDFSEKHHLENYVLYFPLDNINHICRIGRIAQYDEKKKYLLTSVVKLPFFFLEDNSAKSSSIAYEIIIPSWKIKDYPILQNFVQLRLFGEDFSLAFEKMIHNLPSGKELFQDILDHTLPPSNHLSKPHKI